MHRHASINRAYRLVFNRVQGTCAVAPETARSGRAGGTVASAPLGLLHARLHWWGSAMVLGLGLCWALASAAEPVPPPAAALPMGGQVTSGSATVNVNGSTMTVGQASP
ncbi:ESPR-type extended signal peptide-containing protein, partial [Variovorax defluvii]|uniref:ESPR-type extended signal peptide-containing protein n=1 Tax=Variovorax defluvii TaxID=913761 RepID=UPI003CD0B928